MFTFWQELSKIIVGMERTVIEEKQMLGLKMSKGKKPISLEAYELLTKALFESGEGGIFLHIYS